MPRFLIATDGSDQALHAARTAVTMAGWLKEPPSIQVVHVHQPIPVNIHAAVGMVLDEQTVRQYYQEEGEKALAGVRQLLDDARLEHAAQLLIGYAPGQILRYADQLEVDLIVLGACGRGRIAGAVLGSVSGQVLQAARRPVLVVR